MSDQAHTEKILLGLEHALDRNDHEGFVQFAKQIPIQDVADFLFYLHSNRRVDAFRLLPRDLGVQVFAYLDPEVGEGLIGNLDDHERQHLIAGMDPDDRAALLEELPEKVAGQLLTALPADEQALTKRILAYPEDSVGRRMTNEYMAVRAEWTIAQALEHIRTHGRDAELLAVIFVTDEQGLLLDSLRLRRFVLGDPGATVESIMDRKFSAVRAEDDQEKAVETLQHYDLLALPVVDANNHLIGVVTIDDIMDVASEEFTEDFHRQGAVADLGMSLREATIGLLWRKRVPWLVTLVFFNILSGAGIAYFEDTLEATMALVFFLPLLIASGGNAGTQSATLMVRALATGDVRMQDWMRLLMREITVAISLGLTMAVAVALVAWARAPEVAVVVGLTMTCVVLMGSLVGLLLPIVLSKFRCDPATASGPLVTSVADVCGVLVYFSIATWYLGIGQIPGE